jgi:hypothetical protein
VRRELGASARRWELRGSGKGSIGSKGGECYHARSTRSIGNLSFIVRCLLFDAVEACLAIRVAWAEN